MHSNIESILEEDPVLRAALKRCSPATYYAACKFRATGDPAALRTVLGGVIERFVERELRVKLAGPADTLPALRLREDLGLDSLTMMEVVMLAEEVLGFTVSNEELTRLHTLGEVHDFILAKLAEPRRNAITDDSTHAAWSASAAVAAGAPAPAPLGPSCLPTVAPASGPS